MEKKKKPGLINRIIANTMEDPKNLIANPDNFRLHPESQNAALRGSLKELGWLKSVLVNKTTGNIIDGHARVSEAIKQGVLVPVDWVELSPHEEKMALAILDPITEMATRDQEILNGLLDQIETDDSGLKALLADLAKNDEDLDKLSEDQSQELEEKFNILIECDNEPIQSSLLQRLTEEGYQCRSLIS